jgi:hypothetical protein
VAKLKLLNTPLVVLHPAYKLSYFQKRKWPEDWIQTALELVRTEWSDNYKEEIEEISPAQYVHLIFFLLISSLNSLVQTSLTQKYFGTMEQSAISDALETYLTDPIVSSIQDPLAYWHGISSNKNADACLACMALDFLSTPGEQLLSRCH